MAEVVPALVMPVSEATNEVIIDGAANPPAQNIKAPPLAAATPI
jgi:hypothetical protein